MVFPSMGECTMAGPDDDVRVDIDLGEAEREAERIRTWLIALRRRHDLARFEYTRHVRIVNMCQWLPSPVVMQFAQPHVRFPARLRIARRIEVGMP